MKSETATSKEILKGTISEPSSMQGSKSPCIMIVESDAALGSMLSRRIEKLGANVVLAHSASEALPLLNDLAFLGCSLNAILIGYHLHASAGDRILPDFLREFPEAAIAMTIDAEDLAVTYWAKARGIHLLQKPIKSRLLSDWIGAMVLA